MVVAAVQMIYWFSMRRENLKGKELLGISQGNALGSEDCFWPTQQTDFETASWSQTKRKHRFSKSNMMWDRWRLHPWGPSQCGVSVCALPVLCTKKMHPFPAVILQEYLYLMPQIWKILSLEIILKQRTGSASKFFSKKDGLERWVLKTYFGQSKEEHLCQLYCAFSLRSCHVQIACRSNEHRLPELNLIPLCWERRLYQLWNSSNYSEDQHFFLKLPWNRGIPLKALNLSPWKAVKMGSMSS